MTILITGAFGFIGSNLCTALRLTDRYQLIAVDIKEPANHQFHKYYSWNDLGKIDWNKIDVIIHLAGIAHDTKRTIQDQIYFDINVGLTKEIFKHFLQSSSHKFIFFSSVKAIADTVKENFLTEKTQPNPKTNYGKSKLEAETYIKEAAQNWHNKTTEGHLDRKKETYILRPCMIHGPGNKGNLNLLYQIVKKNIPWPLGAFSNKRSFTSFENIAFVISQIIDNEIEPGIYNIADDNSISTNRLIELIGEARGTSVRIWKINQIIVLFLAKIGDTLHLPLNSERLKKLTESYVVSNTKIKDALGIEKMPISLEDGIKTSIKSF